MNQFLKATVYGFIIWLILFAVGFVVFPLHETNLVFFKTIMIVCSSLVGMWALYLYFNKIKGNYVAEGIQVGLIWFIVNILLDLVVLVGMFHTPAGEYFLNTGLRYLMIPIISTFLGFILKAKVEA